MSEAVADQVIRDAINAREAAIEDAKLRQDWSGFVMLHPKPERAEALDEIEPWITDDAEVWGLIGYVWTTVESPTADEDIWRGLFAIDRPGREAIMDAEERAALAELPDPVPVFRGFDRDGGECGFSWTTDRERAEWFARRLSAIHGPARVAIGTVAKSNVIAYLLGRQEHEVVSLPEHVEIAEIVPTRS